MARQAATSLSRDFHSNIDIIPLAFMTAISDSTGHPQLNFANQGDKCTTFDGTQLLNCPELATDIPLCQTQYNKTILLSIGGATYTEGGFANATAATTAADRIWSMFGPPPANLTTNLTTTAAPVLRPFGAAQLDGFDFDFESTVSNISPFAQRLRSLMTAASRTDARPRLLTAAPQCPYPDAADNAFLSGPDAVAIDAVFVQFYNNYCGVQSFVPNATDQWNFNYAAWDTWARTEAAQANAGFLASVKAELVGIEEEESEAAEEGEGESCGGYGDDDRTRRGVEFRA
ncbi:putative class iii [Diplodia seriata]|uniref:chitinase n=1 Tax=Diplodia seriata TaxID=420778 RepID=A0A0G2E8F6_9PEZI|nr:putative class iii [Diplodia seriata]